MSKYVMVDAVSQYRMRYVVEVPDDVGEELVLADGTRKFAITPQEYAMDSVTCENVREFSQKWLGETIVDAREVSLEEAIAQFRMDEPTIGAAWNDEWIAETCITEVGFDIQEYYAEEKKKWGI